VRRICTSRLCNTSGVGGVADNDYYHSEQCAGSQHKHDRKDHNDKEQHLLLAPGSNGGGLKGEAPYWDIALIRLASLHLISGR
jgi:hypothetical protein